jgi:predicted ATPase
VGPGGIGKTRLAVRAAAECERFRDGIYFVPLAGVAASDLLIPALADALGLTLHGSESMQSQLLEWLGEKELLLLLDNFEHLLAAAELNTEILCAAPGVKILVTSRERLNLREEWLFQVEGLRCPLQEDEISSASSFDAYAAVQLFVQGAQRVRLGFAPGNAEKLLVARVCRLVAGTPLAIELAANWVRHLSCQEIVTRIEKSMDFLTTDLRDLPVRHRSMSAVFEQSWRLLSEEERGVFKRLSVFRGGFRQEAAEPVAGANLDRLASLVDKSFLSRTPSGRYEVHELLRQYGAEKLSAAEAAQAREAHGVYFAQFLGARDSDLLGHRVKEALEEIAEDLENIRASWQGFIERRSLLEMGQAGHALFRFYDLRSWFQEGGAVFEQATAALNTLAPEPKQQLVLARLYNLQGIFCNRVQHLPQAIQVLESSIAIARQIDHKKTLFAALLNLAGSHIMHGEFVVSRQLLEEAIVGFRQLDDKPDLFSAQDTLGFLLYKIGDYVQARALLEQILESLQSFGKGYDRAFIYYHLGLIAQAEKETGQAVWSYQQGLSISRETGHTWGATLCTSGLASVALQNGEYDQAVLLAQEGLSQAKKVDNVYVAAMCLNCLGQAAGAKGNAVEAQNYHRHAIRMAWETGQFSLVLDNLIGLAELELKGEQMQSAGELLAIAIHHPSTCAIDRERAERLFVQLESQLTPEAVAAAQKQSLEAVVERILTS